MNIPFLSTSTRSCFICQSPATFVSDDSDLHQGDTVAGRSGSRNSEDRSMLLIRLLNNRLLMERCNFCIFHCDHIQNAQSEAISREFLSHFQQELKNVSFCWECRSMLTNLGNMLEDLRKMEAQMRRMRDVVLQTIGTSTTVQLQDQKVSHHNDQCLRLKISKNFHRQFPTPNSFEEDRLGEMQQEVVDIIKIEPAENFVPNPPAPVTEQCPSEVLRSAYVKLVRLENLPLINSEMEMERNAIDSNSGNPGRNFAVDAETLSDPDFEVGNEDFATERNVHRARLSGCPSKIIKRLACSLCERRFTDKGNLARHQFNIHGIAKKKIDKPFCCPELNCSARFSTRFVVQRHLRVVHKMDMNAAKELLRPKEAFICPKENCGVKLKSALYLQKHLQKKHPIEAIPRIPISRKSDSRVAHECQECGKHFKSRHNLAYHKQAVHLNLRPFMCEVCSLSFKSAVNLKYHQAIHPELNVESHTCEQCGKTFGSPFYLRTHIKTQHQGAFRFQCTYEGCDYKAWTKQRIDWHTNSVHTNTRPWTCDQCGASYLGRTQLVEHQRKHTGEKPYACKICEKAFPRSGKLSRHMKTHLEERNLPCTVCGKMFRNSNDLWSHMRSHDPPEVREARRLKKAAARAKRAFNTSKQECD